MIINDHDDRDPKEYYKMAILSPGKSPKHQAATDVKKKKL
jgi:hypothetical protein